MENFNVEDQRYQTILQQYYKQVSKLQNTKHTNLAVTALNETLILMRDYMATQYESFYISKGSKISDFIDLKSKSPELDYLCYAKKQLDNFFRANADELFIMNKGETYDTTIIPWINSLPSFKGEALRRQLQTRGKPKLLHDCGKLYMLRDEAKQIIHSNNQDLTQIKIDDTEIMLKKCIVNILFQYRVFGFYYTDIPRCSSCASESNGKRPITAVSSSNPMQPNSKKCKPSEAISFKTNGVKLSFMVLHPCLIPNNVVQTIEAVIVNVELQDLPAEFIFEHVDNGFVSVIRENYKECTMEGMPAFKIFFHAPKREAKNTLKTKVVANSLQHDFTYFEATERLAVISNLQQQAEMTVPVYNTVTNLDDFKTYELQHPTNKNPIHIAAFFDDVGYLETLDRHILRAYWNTADKNGETPYMVAKKCKSNAVLEFVNSLEDSVQEAYQEVAKFDWKESTKTNEEDLFGLLLTKKEEKDTKRDHTQTLEMNIETYGDTRGKDTLNEQSLVEQERLSSILNRMAVSNTEQKPSSTTEITTKPDSKESGIVELSTPPTVDPKLHRDVNTIYLEANQLFNHDIEKAIEIYKEAANAGHLESMVALAECLELTNDYETAHVWFEKAAQQGNVEAMKHTAQNYEAGRGCKPSIMKARLWYSQASQKGDDFAAKQLDRL